MLFYVLKLQNLLGIKIPSKDFKLGLNVCFYTRRELREIFKDLEFEVVDYYEDNWKNNKFKKILLLKNWGRMCFVLQPLNKLKVKVAETEINTISKRLEIIDSLLEIAE